MVVVGGRGYGSGSTSSGDIRVVVLGSSGCSSGCSGGSGGVLVIVVELGIIAVVVLGSSSSRSSSN